jgi:hypothetical protein
MLIQMGIGWLARRATSSPLRSHRGAFPLHLYRERGSKGCLWGVQGVSIGPRGVQEVSTGCTLVQGVSKRCPRGVRWSKGCPRGVHGVSIGPRGVQEVSTACPRGVHGLSIGPRGVQAGSGQQTINRVAQKRVCMSKVRSAIF